jgi:plastocyanin
VDGRFESPSRTEAGATFAHVLADAGASRYVCAPRAALGMKGAVVVTEE